MPPAPDDKLWHQQYEKLVDFKRKSSHFMVPFAYEQDKSLGIWVSNQRRKRNKMRPDRKKLLDKIGFAWKDDGDHNFNQFYDKLWHQYYEKLVEFKRKNGNCLVPFAYEQDASLGNWVFDQRKKHKNNKLRLDRKELLDEIGFDWKARDPAKEREKLWHQQFENLVEFKRKNGNCRVPHQSEQEKSLGMWISKQRSIHINNKMRPDRKKVLDEIGFDWKVYTYTHVGRFRKRSFISSVPPPNKRSTRRNGSIKRPR
jgi:hypothetical protein